MKAVQSFNSPLLLIEFGHSSLRALDGERRLEVPFEREADGPLTARAKEELVSALQSFLGNRWGLHRRAVCAIGARGISLRRLRLPDASHKNFKEMLTLQVERELPLSPSELAWGYRRIETTPAPTKSAGEQEFLLAAVRRDLVEEYAAILGACRLTPVFTPGILSLLSLCPSPHSSRAVLDIGRRHSELLGCCDGAVETLRILKFGGDNVTAAIAGALGVREEEAERLKLQWSQDLLDDATQVAAIERAVRAAFGDLASLAAVAWSSDRIFLAGKNALLKNAAQSLSDGLGSSTRCEVIEKKGAVSSTLEALKIETGAGRREPPLVLRLHGTARQEKAVVTAGLRKWGAIAAILVLVSFSFRYAEPLLRKPGLERRLAAATTEPATGPEMNYELTFLQHIEGQRSPYLIVMNALGEATPRGARFESLSINRRGEVSFQTTIRGSEQAIDLRAKLISSGVFSSVVVEEQRPSPQDRNRLIVRISARCKPSAEILATATGSPEAANRK